MTNKGNNKKDNTDKMKISRDKDQKNVGGEIFGVYVWDLLMETCLFFNEAIKIPPFQKL